MIGEEHTEDSDSLNPFKNGAFALTEEADLPKRNPNSMMDYAYITGYKDWEQFNNLELYEIEKAIKELFLSTEIWWKSAPWSNRVTSRIVYGLLYGKEVVGNGGKIMNYISTILAYYSTSIKNGGKCQGKTTKAAIYLISKKRLTQVKPYSLKLRLEWLCENGKIPNKWNMKREKCPLLPGHARSPKTEANMRRRSEEAKQRWYKYKNDRNRKIREEQQQEHNQG
jgi:hypothetical protein